MVSGLLRIVEYEGNGARGRGRKRGDKGIRFEGSLKELCARSES